ncbi:MAG TPA: endolytic transglycosylase MltG [Candidatus Intestinimonas pullistercoris]|uniref:Endolytic murein transglycosylase n=1 Tax=Candidatus Intestinimonas pullistercoris TaxID=2838623 RepID=A0A9D2NZL9_9FIRM|nr:endolytic transglycosylase MltG [uncultured Intestinimonas sp.]HJC41402.1 endolytic transglycosylase MltG [Candidatus Intestinimonas pullistercoris]
MSQEERRTSSGRREQPQERTQREQRPRKKRKKGFNLMGTLLYVAFVIGVSTLLAAVGWVAANDLLALNKAEHSAIITLPDDIFTSREVTVETEDGTETETELVVDMDYVIDTLKENGIIEYGLLFRLYSIFSDAQVKMTPGTYQLDTDMDYRAIVTNLGSNSASRQQVTVTIPEGFTVAQIFQRLEDEGVSTVEKLNEMAATHDYAFSFLQEIPLGEPTRLEGYLFPDTYDFYMGEDPLTVINKMLVNFDRRFTDEMRAEAQANGYSVRDIVIIASMIERETDGSDRATISSVIYNRWQNTGAETAGYLGVDATLVYALGRTITQDDYTADTPYNTYTNQGLPPGPISNPGMASINAAMEPESTNYYYYALGNDGTHSFFRTLSEQQNFIAQQRAES